jgi:lipoate---protein ligase
MFIEPCPQLITPNPGGADDPLGESVLEITQPWLRVFQPRDVRLVIGRHQNPERELIPAHALADNIPMHRRVSGGGAVVLSPGMVVVSLRLKNNEVGTTCYLDRVNAALIPSILSAGGPTLRCRGHGDLIVAEPDGLERKVLGASLRQTAKMVVYLGVFLITDAVPLMERYLAAPSREPDYRAGRGHGAFCTHLSRFNMHAAALAEHLQKELSGRLETQALVN